MAHYPYQKEIILPIVSPDRSTEDLSVDEPESAGDLYATADRMSPGVAGGIAGIAAGVAALGVVHGFDPTALGRPVLAAANAWRVDPSISLAIAYATAGAGGSVFGTVFGVVTRNLRKWGALVLWGLVFFVSLALVVLAFSVRPSPALSAVLLAASAVYGVVVSFSLPIRRRR